MVYYQTYLHNIEVVMYRVCCLGLGPNFGVRLTAKKNFYSRETFEKMHAFAVIIEKYFLSYGGGNTNLTAPVNCRN